MSDLITLHDLPSIDATALEPIDFEALAGPESPRHAPRILIL